jgi:hypothetical protein
VPSLARYIITSSDFSAFLCTSMTVESPAGEDADDSANQSMVSIFF